ncbi:MAG: glycoside hydrolase 15-like protein [Candidatus Saccharibacteria bacterium]|nr:glycoside hydrolase 15-like protein [Candidatus Saccharibacteria bacterium]
MARPVMLGNGTLTVGLNEHGLVHDFYYPYVGLENLTTARSVHHKIGVWIDGQFSWVDDGSWEISVNFESDALVSSIRMHHAGLQIELLLNDFVDSEFNSFNRIINVKNEADEERDVRVFMHQVFQISRAGRADTALFVPDDNYILDYKGRCCLLIYGQTEDGKVYDQFAVGNYGIEGKEGTFRDAEDGELSGSAVEHGGVDSVIRFDLHVAAQDQTKINYWIVAADSQFSAEAVHNKIKDQGLSKRLLTTRGYWNHWLSIAGNKLHRVDAEYLEATKKSLMVVKAHIDKHGGIIASCDSSIYNFGRDYYSYVWPRDGAYAIWPLIRLGYTEEPKKFFEFCRDILTPDGYLMHKYQPDRAIGSTWHPMLHGNRKELAIQEDETASVVYMLGEYFEYSKDEVFVRGMYDGFVKPAANFMASFIDPQTNLPHASYDLWEEKFLTNTYTAAITYQALLVAADFAERFEHPDDATRWRDVAEGILKGSQVFFDGERSLYRKGYLLQQDGSLQFDNTLDVSSLYGVMMFGMHTHDVEPLHQTMTAIENILLDKTPSLGSPRYEHDNYFVSDPPYLGNPWFVTTLWIAQYYVRVHQMDKAKQYVAWTMQHALPSGVLSEQLHPETGAHLSVTPLVWSHAELINTILDINKVT